MKTIKILSSLIIIVSFSQCGSFKFEKKAPFKVISARYSKVSETAETNIYIRYTSLNNINFDSIYFQKKKAKIEIKTINGLNYTFAKFQKSLKKDIILDGNPLRELNNPIPDLSKFPFELKENEAVISYKIKGKTKYYKIDAIKKE